MSSEDPAAPDTGSASFRTLVESAPDAIVAVDARGRIVLANGQAEVVFGYPRDELLGQPVELLVPEALRASHVSERHRYDQHPRLRPMGHGLALQARRKDGTVFPSEISLSPIESPDGPIVVAFIRDITERRRIDDERTQWVRVEAASRAKDEFVAIVSHELRTPLNAIFGWADMLRTNANDPAIAAKAVEAIERSARAQMQLVDDLLDMSRIIAGKLRLDLCDLVLPPVLRAAVEMIRPAAESKAIQIDSEIAGGLPHVRGDAARLQQVVWNLLSNAVKFTPGGGSVVLAARRRGDEAEVTVSDTGAGIDPAVLPHVFERFHQGEQPDSSPSRGVGLGLGLAIVHDIVTLHGGHVEARSEGRGRGATFTVTLPALGV